MESSLPAAQAEATVLVGVVIGVVGGGAGVTGRLRPRAEPWFRRSWPVVLVAL